MGSHLQLDPHLPSVLVSSDIQHEMEIQRQQQQAHRGSSRRNIFHSLPNEIIRLVLLYLPVGDIARARQATKVIDHVASDPTLWRTCCLADFSHWNPEHALRERVLQPVWSGRWKELYALRLDQNRTASEYLEKIIRTQTDRVNNISKLIAYGYDVKDLLFKKMKAGDDVEDVLARRFWSGQMLRALHRSMAIEQWIRLRDGAIQSVNGTMTAFNLFIPGNLDSDFETVSKYLEIHAQRFLARRPDGVIRSTREKAWALNQFVRATHRLGKHSVPPALSLPAAAGVVSVNVGPELHPTLAIVAVTSYCLLAERLQLDARPVLFPFRTRVVVYPPEGEDLDGKPLPVSLPNQNQSQSEGDDESGDEGGDEGEDEGEDEGGDEGQDEDEGQGEGQREGMYLDPYGSDEETSVEELQRLLASYDIPASAWGSWMSPVPVSRLVVISALRVFAGAQEHRQHEQAVVVPSNGTGNSTMTTNTENNNDNNGDGSDDDFSWWCVNAHENLDGAYYGALWALIILGPLHLPDLAAVGLQMRHIIVNWGDSFFRYFPEDALLIKENELPHLQDELNYHQLYAIATNMCAESSTPRVPYPRTHPRTQAAVLYRVGQVFRHRRYGYIGVITGWDEVCKANEEWMRRMGVDILSGGRRQSFYDVV